MRHSPNWKVCLEVGLNHLGSYSHLESMIRRIDLTELNVSITVQIREEDFYNTNKKFYLNHDEYKKFTELCRSLDIPFGFALGPISNLEALADSGLKPDFIKTLSIATINTDFMKRLYSAYDCNKYISTGLSSIQY